MIQLHNENSCTNDDIKRVDGCITFLIGCTISLVIGIWIGISYDRHRESTPVERTNVIDSLVTINDSIKLKVEKLDSIKDAKVIEVSTLDNDSTYKLFYKLVSE